MKRLPAAKMIEHMKRRARQRRRRERECAPGDNPGARVARTGGVMAFLGGRITPESKRVIDGVAPPGKALESTRPASSDPAPRLRFYLHGREITAEEAANAPTFDPPEMELRVIDGAIGTRCAR